MDVGAKVPEIEKPFQLPAYVGVRIDEPLCWTVGEGRWELIGTARPAAKRKRSSGSTRCAPETVATSSAGAVRRGGRSDEIAGAMTMMAEVVAHGDPRSSTVVRGHRGCGGGDRVSRGRGIAGGGGRGRGGQSVGHDSAIGQGRGHGCGCSCHRGYSGPRWRRRGRISLRIISLFLQTLFKDCNSYMNHLSLK